MTIVVSEPIKATRIGVISSNIVVEGGREVIE